MNGTIGSAVSLAGVLLLAQACASGMEPVATGPMTTQTGRAQGTQSYGIYGVDSYFKIEAGPEERRGKPLIGGYITNQWGIATRNVRLRVEALDAAGVVSATYTGYVNGIVTPGSRVYFEVPIQQTAAGYRVSVLSFDPVQGHG